MYREVEAIKPSWMQRKLHRTQIVLLRIYHRIQDAMGVRRGETAWKILRFASRAVKNAIDITDRILTWSLNRERR